MRLIIIVLLVLLASPQSIAQAQVKTFDFVISLDEKVIFGGITKIVLIGKQSDGQDKIVKVDYHPGSLSISQSDYEFLKTENVKQVFLSFTFSEFCKAKRLDRKYDIDINKGFLDNYYYVLYVYNTSNPKYKNVFYPLKGKTYTYEFDYPGGGVRRIRKKLIEDCDW